MDRKEIDMAAYKGKEIDSPVVTEEIYWLGMYYIYKICAADKIPKEQAQSIKAEFVKKIDKLGRFEEIFLDSLRVMTELDKLIEPTSKLPELDKSELVEKIIRFEAVLNGTLVKYDNEIPSMYHKLMKELEVQNA